VAIVFTNVEGAVRLELAACRGTCRVSGAVDGHPRGFPGQGLRLTTSRDTEEQDENNCQQTVLHRLASLTAGPASARAGI
jgi:hypothetical protein